MEQKSVLIIEDDPEICDLLTIHLEDLGCQVTSIMDGAAGFEAAKKQDYDLIILDIRLPSMDGIAICQKLRALEVNTPIIMLTARSEEIDRVLGLEVGADDYMTKPFSVREFIARVKAIFRRSQLIKSEISQEKSVQKIVFDELSIDIDLRKVMLQDKRIELSPKEFDLLVLMASNPGKSYNRSRLLNLIWGYDFEGYEHTVNSHINRLRAKIEPDMDTPKFILTTWGVGYKFNEELVQL
ncbi:MAG: response regulator transcription factor [Cytophagales bacterium]|nr:response regulator transcription factor [Cytophagales bacterium]